MTTQQPEALRLADACAADWEVVRPHLVVQMLRDQHARILELEAAQAQRAPLSADEVKEPKNGKAWRVEWWNESMRMMLPSDRVLHRFVSYQNGTMQFTLKKLVHGITQEKQG